MNNYLYSYRGKEILEILKKKLKVIESVIEQKQSELYYDSPMSTAVPDKIKNPYMSQLDSIFDPVKVGTKKNALEALKKEMRTCVVMMEEMERNKWKKYSLTLNDLVLLKYVEDIKV